LFDATRGTLTSRRGLHALEGTQPCQLSGSFLEDQHWKDALVVRAIAEGAAELTCGSHKVRLVVVKPSRLDLVLVDDHVVVGQRFHVRAVPRDAAGREFEIGKWTEITWHTDPAISLTTTALQASSASGAARWSDWVPGDCANDSDDRRPPGGRNWDAEGDREAIGCPCGMLADRGMLLVFVLSFPIGMV
jgi:hypothetical protein